MKSKTYHDYLFFSMLITIFVLILLLLVYCYYPFNIPACFFITKLGFYCPACGATRAFIHFINGNFIKSLYYNPIVLYCVTSVFIYICLYILSKKQIINEFYLSKYCKICLYVGLFIFIINCFARNFLNIAFIISL